MNISDKKEVREMIVDALNEVIVPVLDDIYSKMATKKDLEKVKQEMATKAELQKVQESMATKADIDRLERRLIARENQGDRLGSKVEDHEKRISRLEKPKLIN